MDTQRDAVQQYALCHVQLLGRLAARRREHGRAAAAAPEPVITRWGTHKAAALLAYLAYHLPQNHAREELAALLWPDAGRAAGLHSLRQAFSSLRRLLEPPGTPAGTVFVADREFLRLNLETVTTDVAAFQAALDRASRAMSVAERRAGLEDAVAGYAGPLLPGHYEEWTLAERERLAVQFLESLDALAVLAEQADDLDEAVAFARRAAQADPLREETQRTLIRLLLAAGRPDDALRQFQEWERRLKQELGDTPHSATRRLAEQAEAARAVAPPPASPPTQRRQPARTLRAPLPTGTPTFLLTDIEGSTAHWERAGTAFQSVLARHHALLRALFARHGGHEAAETGDGFVVAFGRAGDALRCAVEAQCALATETWTKTADPAPRVRMALHTGDVELEKGRYRGLTLHRAQRLLEAGHGGQILCSDATAVLLRGSGAFTENEDGNLTDLGLFRLRDVPGPVRLFQVTYPDAGRVAFGPPRARPGFAGNLPPAFTRFFGREDEIAALAGLLRGGGEDARLVTLTGPGGTGKTRLVLEAAGRVADDFAGAVWFVPLADVFDGPLLGGAIRDALELPRSASADPFEQAVEMLLRPEKALLVLDNFEQLASDGAAAQTVQTLLARVPTLTCLVTSRQLLLVGGEREFAVAPLPVPEIGDDAANTPERLLGQAAIQLFVDRARAALPDFGVTVRNTRAVAELVRRLEGIPLALELAGARASILTPAQMLARLEEHRFELLVSRRRDLPERHRSLRAALDLSYQLLPADLQTFFARLSVFRGGWTAEAAEAICEESRALDFLAQLRECSLVLAEQSAGEETRFRMLETLREFAAEQLTAEEAEAGKRRHGDWFLAQAEAAESRMFTLEQAAWLERLEIEHDNLRAALAFFRSEANGAETYLRMASRLYDFWAVRGYAAEGQEEMEAALARKEAQQRTAARAEALWKMSVLTMPRGDFAQARTLFEESLAIYRELNDPRGIANCLDHFGWLACISGDFPQAQVLLEESTQVYQQLDDRNGLARSLFSLANVKTHQGDYALARTLFERSLDIRRQLGDNTGVALGLGGLAWINCLRGDYEEAQTFLEESLHSWKASGDRGGIALALDGLGRVARLRGDHASARNLLESSLAIRRETGDRGSAAETIKALGWVAHDQHDHVAAVALGSEALTVFWHQGDKRDVAESIELLALCAAAQGKPERTARLLGTASFLREAIGAPLPPAARADHERGITEARAALNEKAFTAAWSEGQAMTLKQAVAYALNETGT